MYPDLLDRIDKNNRDWLKSWGCLVIQLPQAAICLNPDFAHYNGIFAIDCPKREAAPLMQELVEKIKTESGQRPTVWLDRYCKPASLPQILSELGFHLASISYTMYAEPTDVKGRPVADLSSFSIREVENPLELRRWIGVYCQAFGVANQTKETRRWGLAFRKQQLSFFAGVLKETDQPVVTGQLETTHQIGGLYSIGTNPTYRHQGFAFTMTAYLAIAASRFDLKDIYLIAESEDNERFFDRFGFREILQVQNWQQS
ncbi:MAG: hypothetical protein A2126_00480 [Candidatus Woykebacteria bacterium GWB1_45_5]|uniref:N-acetyltransferase domain-containing protein n=2 Tax=Candidatus Woykeibacteriota TaxID=1817899 RepID=A0A1G1W411_9BACT|nr:MAG: hypothetical protein A2113_02775 [Candidatus Woykebacteria bacterium GWA1_44_8]OGY22645.1 MAG: hypothetical protein A2126_00480 [Candidatus Woykebacteria bacterium GWB1_45_5]